MSQSKSLAESLFEDLLKETPVKMSNLKDPLKLKKKSNTSIEKLSKMSKTNSRTLITPDVNPIEDPLSDLVLQNEILMKKLKKCRVRLPKLGQKKISQMIKKSIKKNNKKSNEPRNLNKNNHQKNNVFKTKQSVIRLSRLDIDLNKTVPARKRKISNSPIDKSSTPKKRNSETKLFFKLDTPVNSKRKKSPTISPESTTQIIKKSASRKKSSSPTLQQLKTKGEQKNFNDSKTFTKSHLQEKFGRQYFKSYVRVNKVRSLDNLNVTYLENELERKEKKRLKKKAKGLNKSVSFVETVEVFGESDSDDNTTEFNENTIELDALIDDKNDGVGGGGDDGNLTIDNTQIRKQSIIHDDIIENGDVTENISNTSNDLMVGTAKDKLPGKIGRIRKSFSPLKSEEDQKSPRNKLLRKGDEKIVRQQITDDDDDDDDEEDENNDNMDTQKDDNVEITNSKNDISILSRLESDENETLENNEKSKSTETNKLISDEYESLSSDDINDFIDGKDNENDNTKDKENDNINKILKDDIDDDEDDDYYLPKPKIILNDKPTEKEIDDENDDDIETIDKIRSSVNEKITDFKDNCNSNEMDNEIFHKVVQSIDLLNSNVGSSQSSEQFGEELKFSEDDGDGSENAVDKEIQKTQNETISSASSTKFSFNSFLKSSIQSIKTKIMPESPKRLSTDNITTTTMTTTTSSSTRKSYTYTAEENSNDDMPQGILLEETDDDESSALLGDPVLGGREMSY